MEKTKTPMKDKETKETIQKHIEDFARDLISAYNYGDIDPQKSQDKLVGFVSGLEQEAERRGAVNELNKLKLILNDCVIYINDSGEIDNGVIGSVNRTIDAELKLLLKDNK